MKSPVQETVAKYFYFVSMDEKLSFAASLKVLGELKNHSWLEEKHRADWVRVLSKWRPRLKTLRSREWGGGGAFNLPRDFDLTAWRSFLATAAEEEVEAVLLARILGFREEEIASGLNLTTGTVRYRLGRGLRHLGGYLES